MGSISSHLLSNQAEANTHTMHMRIYPQTWFGLLTGT